MKKKNGFTLVEILVVLSIIGILISLALVSYDGARKTARDGKRKSDLEQVRNALEMRRVDCSSYPVDTLSSGDPIAGSDTSGGCRVCCDEDIYITIPEDPGGRQYVYNSTDGNTYKICASLELDTSGSCTIAGADCGTGSCNHEVINP